MAARSNNQQNRNKTPKIIIKLNYKIFNEKIQKGSSKPKTT